MLICLSCQRLPILGRTICRHLMTLSILAKDDYTSLASPLWTLFGINLSNWLTSVTAGMVSFDPEPELTFASEPFSTAHLRDTASDFSPAQSDI